MHDELCKQYMEFLDNTYDCIDRIVLNAYFIFGQGPGGFRIWWRSLKGGDIDLDNTNLMRFAGRFSRRIRAYTTKHNIPLIFHKRDDRNHELVEQYIPTDPEFRGVYCIIAGRAPASVYDIKKFENGTIDIRKKKPYPYVNHYSFYIMDPQWGRIIIKLCPHPPFNAQIILNGHEYVAKQALKQGICFTKEDNCFTEVSDAAGLNKVADTMKAPSFVGRIVQVCERWIYSACLCFALDSQEQIRTGFQYSFSVYQLELSRNLLFTRGRIMEQVFESIIDRTRGTLNIKTVKTIFGYQRRPYRKDKRGKRPKIEIVVERPAYNLTIFKIHFGKLTVKMYSKGERVLRIEVVVHNTSDLRCGKRIDRFPDIITRMDQIMSKFLSALRSVDASFLDLGELDAWSSASKIGSVHVGGIDVNKPRTRAVMQAVIALSINPSGFSVSDVAKKVQAILSTGEYQSRQASYDLKKFRAKGLVKKIDKSRKYEATQNGLRSMTAFFIIRDKVMAPLLSCTKKFKKDPRPRNIHEVDFHYKNIQNEMNEIFSIYKVAA